MSWDDIARRHALTLGPPVSQEGQCIAFIRKAA
jgi:hypothetical protein